MSDFVRAFATAAPADPVVRNFRITAPDVKTTSRKGKKP